MRETRIRCEGFSGGRSAPLLERLAHVEVRINGRGGQGVVTVVELLSAKAFSEGRHARAFPAFGSERTGAIEMVPEEI